MVLEGTFATDLLARQAGRKLLARCGEAVAPVTSRLLGLPQLAALQLPVLLPTRGQGATIVLEQPQVRGGGGGGHGRSGFRLFGGGGLVDFQKKVLDFCCSFDALESHEELSGRELAVGIFQVVAFIDHLLHEILILRVSVCLMQRWRWPFL